MADTAIWSTLSWPLANVVSARALIYDLVGIVPAFGPCFACSCDQKVRARLFVSSHRYFYKVSAEKGALDTTKQNTQGLGFPVGRVW